MNVATAPETLTEGSRKVRCREIDDADLPAVTDLLVEGFPRRPRRYWARGLRRLQQRDVPAGCPRYGFAIDVGGTIVGCLLLIVSDQTCNGRIVRRANVSSWFVKPAYRFQASMLVSVAFRRKDMTFVNISPAPHTLPILEAQGYTRFSCGQMITVPSLAPRARRCRVVRLRGDDVRFGGAQLPDIDMLRRHAQAGCIVLLCVSGERIVPFVFAPRRILRTIVPAAHLIWCRDIADYPRYAAALGRRLLCLGRLAVSLDANGPMPEPPGVWRPGQTPKFYRGPDRPRLGDLADTELVYFGA